ncbi:MAG: hypothetical protein EOP09_05140 [Proteobacteria bacterium]|nr:MAG: hypothetical protein EOP09_05140 [Pseudomonadota bacterium]
MIYVFKTSVRTKAQAKSLKPHIDRLLAGARWNFDLQDCDKVLRIDCPTERLPPVAGLLQEHGFACEELE